MIKVEALSLVFPHKICFENFSTVVQDGERIAIVGRNGSGKSSLLKMIAAANANVGYVPQLIDRFEHFSGGERFNRALSQALSMNPDALLLDEPTNHLDLANRNSLLRMLQNYFGTLLIVTHDREILRKQVDTIWHIDDGKIHIFRGKYDDYMADRRQKREAILRQIEHLNVQKKAAQQSSMKEQERIAKSRANGRKKVENRRWLPAVAAQKINQAEKVQGAKLKAIDTKKQELAEQLEHLKLPETIVPKFSISAADMGNRMLLSIRKASVGYGEKIVLRDINLSLMSREHLAIVGSNGSGKTTLIRAILREPSITKTGEWDGIPSEQIGHLDQFYATLDAEKTVFETLPDRRALNGFLFRKNEEVYNKVKNLSGGEKVRLSLALLSVRTPWLLILDEITNNLDLETKEHVVQVLRAYPGAMVLISHEQDFLEAVRVDQYYAL
jgi:ATPase subunit of ABC transporter with duplicated ATPase domains